MQADYVEQNRCIAKAWIGCIDQAAEARKWWEKTADMCRAFYSEDCGFLFQDKFQKQYLQVKNTKDMMRPARSVTVNKAFEYVSLYGPSLFWDYPNIQINSPALIELYPEIMGDVQDPMVMEQFQQMVQMDQAEQNRNKTRNDVMSKWLNFTQREQSGGGKKYASERAIQNALLDGRGVLYSRVFQFPGSQRKMTGSFHVSPRDIYIDPDATDCTCRDAGWIAVRYREPSYVVEERFNLQPGSLYGKGSCETKDSMGRNNSEGQKGNRKANPGYYNDMIEWYEIYSKRGVGSRNPSARKELDVMFDEVVGNYARVCVARNVDFILNCPPSFMMESDVEQIKQAMDWPTPLWRDDSWPFKFLDFYPKSDDSAWPLPPLAPALGYLICISLLNTLYVNKAWENSQTIIAMLKAAGDDVKRQMQATDQTIYVELTETMGKSITEIIQILQRPNNGEQNLLEAMSVMQSRFDQCTGLTELMYGGGANMSQSRSARDAEIKNEKVMIRPDYMAKKVAEWHSQVADTEKNIAYWNLTSQDVSVGLGTIGSYLWDQLILTEDPEVIFRSSRAIVLAQDIQRPDKAKLLQNINTASQQIIPSFMQYAMQTGDYAPLNAFNAEVMKAMELDVPGMDIQPPQPQEPSPEQQEMQQLQNQKMVADIQKTLAEAGLKESQAMAAAQQQQGVDPAAEMKLQMDAQQAQQSMLIDSIKAAQDMQIQQAKARQDMQIARMRAAQQVVKPQTQGV